MITSLERSKIVVANRDREGVGRGLAVPWKTEADLIRERWGEKTDTAARRRRV